MTRRELDVRLERIYELVAYDETPDYGHAIERLNEAAALVIGLRETLRAEVA
jgi:hypothetical protein